MAKHLHEDAMTRSGGKAVEQFLFLFYVLLNFFKVLYKKVLPMLAQQKTQQMQQQQSMMNSQVNYTQNFIYEVCFLFFQQQQQQQQSMMNSQVSLFKI